MRDRPVLGQLEKSKISARFAKEVAYSTVEALGSMQFVDLNPDVAKKASPVGIHSLGTQGENLSSVLQSLWRDENRRQQLLDWVRALTPMDVVDIHFTESTDSRVMAVLVEDNGAQTPLTSASDGTIRFLAYVAALLGSDSPHFLFFEELENGIHPNRLYLLLDLITRATADSSVQVAATTHSPSMLLQVNQSVLNSVALVFRTSDRGSQILSLVELPGAREVLRQRDIAALMTSGWFENTALFATDEGRSDEH
jgi:predicted ATPase